MRGRHEFTAASNARVGCHTLIATVLSGKGKEGGEAVFMWLFYMRLAKKKINAPITRSCRNFLLIIKGLSFSILTWLNKKDWFHLISEQVSNSATTITPSKETKQTFCDFLPSPRYEET